MSCLIIHKFRESGRDGGVAVEAQTVLSVNFNLKHIETGAA